MNKPSAPLRDRHHPLVLVGAASLHCAMPKLNLHAGLGARNYLLLQADVPIYIIEYLLGLLVFLSFPVHSPVLCPEAEEEQTALCTLSTPELHWGLLLSLLQVSALCREGSQPLWVVGRTAGSRLPWLGAEASSKPSFGKCAVVIVLNCWLQTSSLLSKDTFYKFANLHVAKIPLWFI